MYIIAIYTGNTHQVHGAVEQHGADWHKNDADNEEQRENRGGCDDWLPGREGLLFETSVCNNSIKT